MEVAAGLMLEASYDWGKALARAKKQFGYGK
jgi:hypothetical protein